MAFLFWGSRLVEVGWLLSVRHRLVLRGLGWILELRLSRIRLLVDWLTVVGRLLILWLSGA